MGTAVAILCVCIMFIMMLTKEQPKQPQPVANVKVKVEPPKKTKPKPLYDKKLMDEAKDILVMCGYKATEAKKALQSTWHSGIKTADQWTQEVFKAA